MPLYLRKPFKCNELPEDLSDSEEVFYCEITNEIFRDYEEFCERIILCNSLVWSCLLSGKANLTYQEALASEETAKLMLKDFPMELRIPVLFLTTLTQRKSLNELAEDVYCFAKDRYFIGETVEVEIPGGSLTTCNIIRVIAPTEETLSAFKKQETKIVERQYWPPATLYSYEVQIVEYASRKCVVVSADLVHRKKSVYSRAKNRLYIKQFTELINGFYQLKQSTADKFGISKVKFNLLFVGEAPNLGPRKPALHSQSKPNGSKKDKKQESIEKYFTKKSPYNQQSSSTDTSQKTVYQKLKEKYQVKNNKNNNLSNKIAGKHDVFRQKRKYTKKNLLQTSDKNSPLSEAELKLRKKEEKMKLKQLEQKKKEQVALLIKEYHRKKDDLELEDLLDLPNAVPIALRIPNKLFGEFMVVLEFLNIYKDTVGVRDYFPSGVTIDLLERAIMDCELAGPLCDILQMLLTTIFELQEDEDDEIREDSNIRTTDELDTLDLAGDQRAKETVRQATIAARWSQTYHCTALSKLTMDASTLTEVLRLHLLASGGRCGDSSSKWRYQQRGGYSSLDDPGLELRLSQPHILKALSRSPFCDLPVGDKLSLLSCLVNQILTFATVRDIIEERMDKIKQAKHDIRGFRKFELEALQKLKDGEWTAEQYEKERELISQRKEEQKRRARELSDENHCNQLVPLGMDRAYRRYWMFSAVPGLFVEHSSYETGTCLPKGTPALNLALQNGEDPECYIKRLFQQGSNKENLATTPTKSPTSTLKSPMKGVSKTSTKGTPSKNNLFCENSTKRPLTCWADPSCPVHGSGNGVTWAFYMNEKDVDALITSLNRRGLRESGLRTTLEEDRAKIVESITKCPASKLSPEMADQCPTDETRKSVRNNNNRYDNANLNFPPGTPSEEILESVLRDLILETEYKVNNGCLGSLKVNERSAWREAILNNSYDKQCDKLSWGSNARSNGELSEDVAGGEDEGQSRPCTPSSDVSLQHLCLELRVEQSDKVRQLASAVLQLEQSINTKYMRRPLGQDLNNKNKKNNNSDKANKATQLARERWEMSLMESTSLSQIFLHFSTLDSSIKWGQSILRASCRICRRVVDPDKMLLCDGCNKGHHMYCLKPKLDAVPTGDWYCSKCAPRYKPTSTVKKRRIFLQDIDGEEEEKENEQNSLPIGRCKVCRTNGHVISCAACTSGYHFDCVVPVLRKIPSGGWYCQKCRKGSAPNKKEETSPSSDIERTSRRRSSKAATAKISQFAKQLRTNNWEGAGEAEPVADPTRRRSRRSFETEVTENKSNTARSDLPLDNATLQEILDQLMHHEDAWPFLRPVTRADVQDYHKIIKHPMDFGTIKHKLNMLEYRTNGEVLHDALLVFDNCYAYNKEDTEIYQCGVKLHKLLDTLCNERGLSIASSSEGEPDSKKARTSY